MKHTKAPWRVERTKTKRTEIVEIIAGSFDIVCRVNRKNRVNHITRELPQGANACLIAAAPELLEACKAITESRTAWMIGELNWQEKLDYAARLARAAIAKAEGK